MSRLIASIWYDEFLRCGERRHPVVIANAEGFAHDALGRVHERRASAWWVRSLPRAGRHEPPSAPSVRIKRQMGPPSPSASTGRSTSRRRFRRYPRQASRRTPRYWGVGHRRGHHRARVLHDDAALRRLHGRGRHRRAQRAAHPSTSPRQPRLPTVDKEGEQGRHGYDLGGGTFDVSVLSINGGVIEVLATAATTTWAETTSTRVRRGAAAALPGAVRRGHLARPGGDEPPDRGCRGG